MISSIWMDEKIRNAYVFKMPSSFTSTTILYDTTNPKSQMALKQRRADVKGEQKIWRYHDRAGKSSDAFLELGFNRK